MRIKLRKRLTILPLGTRLGKFSVFYVFNQLRLNNTVIISALLF